MRSMRSSPGAGVDAAFDLAKIASSPDLRRVFDLFPLGRPCSAAWSCFRLSSAFIGVLTRSTAWKADSVVRRHREHSVFSTFVVTVDFVDPFGTTFGAESLPNFLLERIARWVPLFPFMITSLRLVQPGISIQPQATHGIIAVPVENVPESDVASSHERDTRCAAVAGTMVAYDRAAELRKRVLASMAPTVEHVAHRTCSPPSLDASVKSCFLPRGECM